MNENYMDKHFENWRPAVRRFGFMTVGVLIGIILTRILPMDTLMGVIVPILVIVAVGIVVLIFALTVWELEKKDTERI
jgi:uncharacterized membrane protein YfcA